MVLIFEQKKGTSLDTPCYKDASRGKHSVRGQTVCLSQLDRVNSTRGSTRNLPTRTIQVEAGSSIPY
jgi:hypothetical protein